MNDASIDMTNDLRVRRAINTFLSLLNRLVLICTASTLLIGCASSRGGDAPQSYLEPSPGMEPVRVSSYSNFQAYADAVEAQLQNFRVPFKEVQSDLEITRAKPVQFDTGNNCSTQSARGIVLLVHGLSDTAFAMHDLARFLSTKCFIARTVLLPGHGTRPGDLLVTDLTHWQRTVSELVDQAASEHEQVVLAGFSLGAVLTLSASLEQDTPVDALVALSPAYTLSSYRLARFAPYLHRLKRWIDRGLPDDYLRYEAMPTRGVAETVNAMKLMHRQVRRSNGVKVPWLMIQSMDDAVIQPLENIEFFNQNALHAGSRMVNLYTDQETNSDASTTWLRGDSEAMRVLGITHVGVPMSPNNPHYGINGDYRNCGQTAPRDPAEVAACLQAEDVWYGLWNRPDPAGLPVARNSFNPQFDLMTQQIAVFLDGALDLFD